MRGLNFWQALATRHVDSHEDTPLPLEEYAALKQGGSHVPG